MTRPPARLLAAPAVPGLFVLAGCGGGFDYSKLENDIGAKLDATYADTPAKVSAVDCQEIDDPMPDDTFTCLADVGADEKVRVKVTVTQINDYKVDYETVDVVFDLDDTVKDLERDVSDYAGFPVAVDCGGGIAVVAVGDAFTCTATHEAEGESADLVVTAEDAEGDVSWEVID